MLILCAQRGPMRRLRLQCLARVVAFVMLLRPALAPGDEWPLSEIEPASLFGHAPYSSSLPGQGSALRDDSAEFGALAEGPNAPSSTGNEPPHWGLPPSDVFPICNCDESLNGW